MFKFIMDMTVYNKPLSNIHKEYISDVLKAIRPIFNTRSFDFELIPMEETPAELLEAGKIRFIVYGLQDPV